MSDVNIAPVGGADPIVPAPVLTPAAESVAVSPREAANQLSKWRGSHANPPKDKPDEPPAKAEAPPQNQALEGDDAAAAQQPPGETTEEAEPAELPPIEPPRSWTKDEKEEFATYPREAQEKIARREQDREAALRRSQNEAADIRKAAEAERLKVEQARQQYEAALPALLQTIQTAQSGEFADIKTQEDVTKLANEDWPRFARWQAHMMQVATVEKEVTAAQQRQADEFKSKWSEFATKEDQLLLDKAPELADKAQQQKIADGAVKVLREIGFSEKELASAWGGETAVSLRDHRVQLLILDAMKYRDAKTNVAKPTPKPVPQMQRPGTAKSRGDEALQQVKSTREKLQTARGIEAVRAGVQLLHARRAARG